MQKIALIYLATALIAVTQLSGCAGTGAAKLPSGDQVAVTKIGKMFFSQGPPALTISFISAYDPVNDFHNLRREADELFAFEKGVIDASHLDNVILQANHRTGGSTFVWTARGYNFVYHKTLSGWCAYQPDRSCKPFQQRADQGEPVTLRIAPQDSGLATIIGRRYATLNKEFNRDDGTWARFLAPDFVETDLTGQEMSRAQAIQVMESRPKDPLSVANDTLLALKRKAHAIVVLRRLDVKTIKPAADGEKLNVEFIWLSTDSWVSLNGTWLLQTRDVDQMDYYLNGRLIDHLSRGRTPS